MTKIDVKTKNRIVCVYTSKRSKNDTLTYSIREVGYEDNKPIILFGEIQLLYVKLNFDVPENIKEAISKEEVEHNFIEKKNQLKINYEYDIKIMTEALDNEILYFKDGEFFDTF